MSDGIRSGVNWMRLNLSVDRIGERLDEQRLRQARHAAKETVPAREQTSEDLTANLTLPDDDATNFAVQSGDELRGFFERQSRRVGRRRGQCGQVRLNAGELA